MATDAHEMYHGTAANRVKSIRETGLCPSAAGYTLSSSLQVASAHARDCSEDNPVILAYEVPYDQFDEYFYAPKLMNRELTFYALKRDLPGDWLVEVIPKSDPRVEPFYR